MKASLEIPRKKILIVDDDPIILKVITVALNKARCDVETALNAAQALDKALNGDFDLIVTDVHMPGGSGLELMKELRAKGYEKPIYLISGEQVFGNEDTEKLGHKGFFKKPFTPARLILKLELDHHISTTKATAAE